MWWIIALAVAVLVVLIVVVLVTSLPKFRLMQKLMDRVNLVTREFISGLMVIRAFNTQKAAEKKFDVANLELTDVSLFVNRVMVFLFPMMMLIMNGTMLLIIWVGAHQVDQSAMQVGDMMAAMQYTMQIIFAFIMISMVFIMLPRASVSAARVIEVVDTEPSIKDPVKAGAFQADLLVVAKIGRNQSLLVGNQKPAGRSGETLRSSSAPDPPCARPHPRRLKSISPWR